MINNTTVVWLIVIQKACVIVQGLFVPFARVGSGDPVRVLCLLHNKYAGYDRSIYYYYVKNLYGYLEKFLIKLVMYFV